MSSSFSFIASSVFLAFRNLLHSLGFELQGLDSYANVPFVLLPAPCDFTCRVKMCFNIKIILNTEERISVTRVRLEAFCFQLQRDAVAGSEAALAAQLHECEVDHVAL